VALAALFIVIFDWNWVHGLIEHRTTDAGRVIIIRGDIRVKFGWLVQRNSCGRN
jgi:uncharacterized protein involved in outer membrane biogenesis